jgi:serine/threonine-protein kinase
VLYQLVTGEKPFSGGYSSVQHKAINTEPTPPSTLSVTAPLGIDAVVARAMAKRPDGRFATAGEFAKALLGAMAAPTAALPMAALPRWAMNVCAPIGPPKFHWCPWPVACEQVCRRQRSVRSRDGVFTAATYPIRTQ